MTSSSESALEFGLFFQVPVAPDQSEATRYAETIAQVVLGDKLGFQTAWLAEGHFLRPFSALSAPLVLAAALSQKTQRIRLGTAATLLPLHHRLRVAEEAATMDLLSGGRLDLGVSRGPAAFYGRTLQRNLKDDVPGRLGAVFFVHPSAGRAMSLKATTATLEHYYAVTRGAQPDLDVVALGSAVFGSAQECLSRVSAIRIATGLDQLVCWFNPGGLLPHGEVCAAMEWFASEVMPAFRRQEKPPEPSNTEIAA